MTGGRLASWFVVLMLVLGVGSGVAAQSANPAPPPSTLAPADYAAATDIDSASIALQFTVASLRARTLDDAALRARIAAIPPIEAKLAAALATLAPHLKDADARLVQLGPAPTGAQPPESAETAATRRQLTQARNNIDAEVKQARLLTVEAGQLDKALSEQLRGNFHARLWARDRSVLDPGLWRGFAASAPDDIGKLLSETRAEAKRFAAAVVTPATAPALIFAGVIAFGFLGPLRFVLNAFARRRAERGVGVTPLRRALLAMVMVLVAALTPLIAGVILRSALIDAGALTPVAVVVSALLIRVVVFAATLDGLGRALLSPYRPRWRLAPMPDKTARGLAPYPALIGGATALATFVTGLNAALRSSPSSSAASDCLMIILELAAVGSALAMAGQVQAARRVDSDSPESAGSRLPWVIAALCAWIAVAASLGAVLLGYRALAAFLVRETVWIAAVLALLFLLLRFVDELFPALTSPEGKVGRAIETALGLSHAAMEQIGVLLSGVARLLLLLLGWTAILQPFGASAGDLATRVTGGSLVLHLGQVSISPGAIAGGVALFLAGLVATRAVRGWLEKRYLPKTSLDAGLRNSVGAGVTYLGIAIAILIAFAYLGLSFSKIALVASALSVGIGFGLQAIIGNFVSGLILLAERPVQVGDWIAIGDLEGNVQRINIRATEIEMNDRSKLIVPNSDLVSKTVRNITHGGAIGRVKIVLKVNDAADPADVRDVVMAPVEAHAEVLRDPAPAAYLTDVIDGAMEFTILAYVASPRAVFHVKSELLFQIVPELANRGIDLANTTPIVNVGMNRRTESASQTPEAAKS
jgi:potassium efflux system protein